MKLLIGVSLLLGSVQFHAAETSPGTLLTNLTQACYPPLGCFSTGPPFASVQRPISLPPQSPDTIKTRFILYTRESTEAPQDLDARFPETVLKTAWSNFKVRPTKIIVHGFLENVETVAWMKALKTELLKYDDYNVVIVDWVQGAQAPYSQAAANARVVGAQIAALINHLTDTKILLAKDFHLIGHSLGAHVVGYAGERVTGLDRISGLDAAGPYFQDTDRRVRLDDTDAVFVDAIHTDADPLIGFGTKTLSGHADYFPNYGYHQPGCHLGPVNISIDEILKGVIDIFACNHHRSFEYFIESINSACPFLARPCASESDFKNNLCNTCGDLGCSRMGFHADENKPPPGQTVKYYLTTGDSAPFCRASSAATV